MYRWVCFEENYSMITKFQPFPHSVFRMGVSQVCQFFQFYVWKFCRFQIAHLRRFRACFYRTQVSLVRSMGPVLCHKLRDVFADLTDVILVDEDTNSIPTNNTNRTIQDNVAMPVSIQVTNLKTSASGLMANIETNASCLAFSIVL